MALTDADKSELKSVMSEAFAEGLALFRSKTEEEEAKKKPAPETKPEGKPDDSDNSFSFAGFILGGK